MLNRFLFKDLQITITSISLIPDKSFLSTNEPTIVIEMISSISEILLKISDLIFFLISKVSSNLDIYYLFEYA